MCFQCIIADIFGEIKADDEGAVFPQTARRAPGFSALGVASQFGDRRSAVFAASCQDPPNIFRHIFSRRGNFWFVRYAGGLHE